MSVYNSHWTSYNINREWVLGRRQHRPISCPGERHMKELFPCLGAFTWNYCPAVGNGSHELFSKRVLKRSSGCVNVANQTSWRVSSGCAPGYLDRILIPRIIRILRKDLTTKWFSLAIDHGLGSPNKILCKGSIRRGFLWQQHIVHPAEIKISSHHDNMVVYCVNFQRWQRSHQQRRHH